MITVNAVLFLFIIQFLLIFIALTVAFYLQNKKQKIKLRTLKFGIEGLSSENETRGIENDERLQWKNMLANLQSKFEQIREANLKLTTSMKALIPESEKSKEHEQFIAQIEQSNKELDACITSLSMENAILGQQVESYKDQVKDLSVKQESSIHKAKYEKILAINDSLELRVESLNKELKEVKKANEDLEKKYIWLENEYNALYENISNPDSQR